MAMDPVCGMQVQEDEAVDEGLESEYGDTMFYFCSEGCKEQFEEDPERFIGPPGRGGTGRDVA